MTPSSPARSLLVSALGLLLWLLVLELLGGRDATDLRQRCERASALLGWPAPYAHAASAAAGSTSTTFDFSGAITP